MKGVKLTFLILVASVSFALLPGCTPQDTSQPEQSTQQTEQPKKLTHAISGYFSAVLLLESDAISVEIHFPDASSNRVIIEREDPRFAEIIQHLKKCISGSITQKTKVIVENGVTKTVHVAIPYAYGHFLDFELQDGAKMRFNVSDEVWFETEETIYNAIYKPAFKDFLNAILPRT